MGDFERTVREFKRTLTGGRQKTSPLDIMGKVTRVEDGVAWVRFAGSEVGDTPVRMNIDCKVGDVVQVRSSDGKAWIVGNQSAPPTDDSKAEEVEKKTTEIVTRVEKAEKVAGSAADVANAVNQKVWEDEAGLHIADGKQDAAAERNSIWNSLGMLFRKGLNPILGVLTGDNPRVAIYDGQGGGEEHEVASFGASARMGKGKEAHVFVEGNRILAEDGDSDMYAVRYFDVGLIDEGDNSTTMSQIWSIEEQVTGKVFELTYYPVNLNGVAVNGASVHFQQSVDNPKQIYIPATLNVGDEVGVSYTTYGANSYFTFGRRQTDSEKGYTSFAAGINTVASGYASHAEGRDTVASGMRSHAEGVFTKAQGHESHAEGGFTSATGEYSHAENYRATAKGKGAHAEGLNTQANGQYSHAEGNGCIADTDNAHAEGSGTRAQAYNSHAGGFCTVADSREQTVIGRFNAATRTGSGTKDDPYEYGYTGDYALVIGNGLDDATEDRSNALTVDWDGTIRTHKNSMKTLWSGAWWMNEGQTATLEEKVSEQLTGIVLVWSYYTGGAAQNYGWHTTFIPKAMVQLHNDVGWDIELRRTKNATFGTKYVYVNDDRIVGHADNIATGTANNVPYKNNQWVLRYVFGC